MGLQEGGKKHGSKKNEELGRSAVETVQWLRGIEASDPPAPYTSEHTRYMYAQLQGITNGQEAPPLRNENGEAGGKHHKQKSITQINHQMAKHKPEEIHQSLFFYFFGMTYLTMLCFGIVELGGSVCMILLR